MNKTSFLDSTGLSIVVIILAGLYIYAPSLQFDFVYDDHWMIVNNPSLDSVAPPSKFFFDAKTVATPGSGIETDVYRPLSTLSFAIHKNIFGLSSTLFRFCNVLLHLLNSIILFLILKRYFKILPAFFGALFFIIHPVQVESVVWISQRSILLCTLGVLISFWFWEDAAKNKRLILLCALAYLFALLGKETAILLPLLFVACVCQEKIKRKKDFISLGFVLIFYIALRSSVLGRLGQSTSGSYNMSESLIHGIQGLSLYAKNIFWPFDLNVSYPWPGSQIGQVNFVVGLLVLIGLVVGLWTTFNKKRSLFIGLSAFVVFWFPHSGIFQLVAFAADRFLYLPMVGLAIIVAALARNKHCRIVFFLIGIIYGGASLSRVQDWRNNESLWRSSIATDESNAFAYANLAQEMRKQGHSIEAIHFYETALQKGPTVQIAWAILKNLVNLSRETNDRERIKKWSYQLKKTEEQYGKGFVLK